jgi:hypothetical protein
MTMANHPLRARQVLPVLTALTTMTAVFGCAEPTEPLTLTQPDMASFRADVYPVLLRDCGFHGCHGSSERFFQVYGPGRGRMGVDVRPLDPANDLEVNMTYQRALSLIDPAAPEQSRLLRKPLAVEAGGAGHQGVDDFGRDVYQDELDPGYAALYQWAVAQPITNLAGAAGGGVAQPGTGATMNQTGGAQP